MPDTPPSTTGDRPQSGRPGGPGAPQPAARAAHPRSSDATTPTGPAAPFRRGVGPGTVIAGVVALLVTLGVGIAIGVVVGDRGTAETAPSTATGPASYATEKVDNACDLVDPAPLVRWAGPPREAPKHTEDRTPPRGGELECRVYHGDPGADSSARAAIWIRVKPTDGATPEAFAARKVVDHRLVGDSLSDVTSGDVDDLAYGHWIHAADRTGAIFDDRYLLDVLDGDLSVLVLIDHGSAAENRFGRAEFAAVARSQVQRILDRLRR